MQRSVGRRGGSLRRLQTTETLPGSTWHSSTPQRAKRQDGGFTETLLTRTALNISIHEVRGDSARESGHLAGAWRELRNDGIDWSNAITIMLWVGAWWKCRWWRCLPEAFHVNVHLALYMNLASSLPRVWQLTGFLKSCATRRCNGSSMENEWSKLSEVWESVQEA